MAAGWIKRKTRLAIYARDNMQCCYCGKTCKPGSVKGMSLTEQHAYMKENYQDFATLDHIVSQWEIAQTVKSDVDFRHRLIDPQNLVTVCNACNSSKRHTELYIWASNKGLDYAAILVRISERIKKAL